MRGFYIFTEYEDEHFEIENQRFCGFMQLPQANGFSDASYLRDATASENLQEAGLPAAGTACYEFVLDYGEGSAILGPYKVIEVVNDTVVDLGNTRLSRNIQSVCQEKRLLKEFPNSRIVFARFGH